jgi:hypothetical protein
MDDNIVYISPIAFNEGSIDLFFSLIVIAVVAAIAR